MTDLLNALFHAVAYALVGGAMLGSRLVQVLLA